MFRVIKSATVLLFMSLIGLVFALVLVEGLYRLSSGMGSRVPIWNDRPVAYINPKNATTLQGNQYNPRKPPEVYRIAVLGDSFTFAPYMQVDDAFPARLERFLRMSADSNQQSSHIEVINYGVPGFSTSHEANEAKRAVAEGADLLILQITLNDPQRKSYQPTGLTGKNQFGPYEPPQTLKKILPYWKSLGYFLERIHNTNTHSRYIEYYHTLFEEDASWNSFKGSVEKLAKFARKKNTPLVAVVFPLFGVPLDNDYPFHPLHDKVQLLLEAENIPNTDLFRLYENIPLERIQVIPGADFHPNEIGHRLAAEAIYDWLAGFDYIPKAYMQAPRFKARTDIRLLDQNRIREVEKLG